MKTSIQILAFSFLFATETNFVCAQNCPVTISGNTTISIGGCTTLNAFFNNPNVCLTYMYSWNTGSSSASITVCPTVTTVYCVTGWCDNCYDTACVTVTVVTTPGGVPENNLSNQIHVYPNPFSESAVIHIDDAQLIPSELKIYDLLGKEVKSYRIESAEEKIYRNNLSSGLYYYRLLQKGQIIGIGKLMIE